LSLLFTGHLWINTVFIIFLPDNKVKQAAKDLRHIIRKYPQFNKHEGILNEIILAYLQGNRSEALQKIDNLRNLLGLSNV
jgi:hypothetical protein